jgi:hypothetical protein
MNTNKIKWRKVDADNLPDGQVLALWVPGGFILGHLELYKGKIYCEGDECNVIATHYITETDLLNLEME